MGLYRLGLLEIERNKVRVLFITISTILLIIVLGFTEH